MVLFIANAPPPPEPLFPDPPSPPPHAITPILVTPAGTVKDPDMSNCLKACPKETKGIMEKNKTINSKRIALDGFTDDMLLLLEYR
jgi:hypothetical protein